MSYFAAGAWWSSDGTAWASQAEAEQHEQQVASGQGGVDDDAFAAASGARSTPAGQGRPTTDLRSQAQRNPGQAAPSPYVDTRTPEQKAAAAFASGNIGGAGGANPGQVLTDRAKTPSDPGVFRQFANTVGSFLDNPVVNPVGYAASKVGGAVDRALGTSVSGYIQDPVGQALNDLGAPDAVQAVANPTGYVTRTAVNADTGYGTRPGAILNQGAQAFDNLRNDGGNVVNAVKQAPGAIAGAVNSIGNAATSTRGSSNAPTYTPPPLPTASMSPQQILGMQTNAARPSSAQSDAIVNQMLAQSQVQSGYQDFSSPQYDQSRGTVNQITGQLQAQANNNVGDIQANSAQRDQSRNAVMDTAGQLTSNANRNIGPIVADNFERTQAGNAVQRAEGRLMTTNDVGDIRADQSLYTQSRNQSNDIIARLLGASELPEGPSAAEALMLNAQERATRNAYGDASSLAGGWRSQLTGQRRALGQAAAQQADIAAQLGALRANETAANRDRQLAALNAAGGFSGDMSGRDLDLAQFDAALLAQIRQGNQDNTRDSAIAAGQLGLGRMNDATAFSTANANRDLATAQSNQTNRLNSLLGAGNLQTGAMQSDTGLAQSNASLLAQIRQGNQANALASLTAAGQNAGQVLTSDANIGMNNANNRVTVDQNNRANSIAALQNAGVLSSTIRGQDVQLSIADQQALTSRISTAAQLEGTQFATKMDAALRIKDQELKAQQLQILAAQNPTELERWLGAAGSAAGLLGVFL